MGCADAATACSSATSRARTSRSTRPRAPAASSTRCTTSCCRCPTPREVWPGHLGRLDVRRARHGPEGVVDDRVRAREPAAAPGAGRGRLRAPGHRRRSAPSRRTSRTSSRSTAVRSRSRRWTCIRSPRGRCSRPRPTERSSWTCAPSSSSTRRTSRRRCASRRCAAASAPGWRGWREPGQPLVLVGRDDEDAREAAELAGAVGLTNIAGYLAGGMTSWREEKQPVERVERLSVEELHEPLGGDGGSNGIQLLDVRERSEWDAGPHPRLHPHRLPRHPRAAGRARRAAGRSP